MKTINIDEINFFCNKIDKFININNTITFRFHEIEFDKFELVKNKILELMDKDVYILNNVYHINSVNVYDNTINLEANKLDSDIYNNIIFVSDTGIFKDSNIKYSKLTKLITKDGKHLLLIEEIENETDFFKIIMKNNTLGYSNKTYIIKDFRITYNYWCSKSLELDLEEYNNK